jgi:hypothetical protein
MIREVVKMMMVYRDNLQIYIGSETPLSLVLHTYRDTHAQSRKFILVAVME